MSLRYGLGNSVAISTYVGSLGEIGVNTTTNTIHVFDGVTVGGISLVKSGGTSSQFLKADGSVDSSTYLTSYTETDTLNSVTGRGNSTANDISVGVLTATSGNFSSIITSSGAVISGVITASSFSGNIGIGTTNPKNKLDVRGDITLGSVGINSIASVTDINCWEYTGKFKSASADDTVATDVFIGAAGTALYVVGDTNNRIFQYTLSTAYDVSTAGAATTSFSVATQETNPSGVFFKPDGTKMFVIGQTGVAPLTASADYIHEYSLSTPWSVNPSSVGYTTSYNQTQDTAPTSVGFSTDGTTMYVLGNTNDTVYQYTLSTPWSVASGSVTYASKSLSVTTRETSPTGLFFNSTGTVLWITGQANDRVYEYRLGTAWDITTAVFYDDVYIGFTELASAGIFVETTQNAAYIIGSTNNTVYQYKTDTPAIEIASSGIATASAIVLQNETRIKDDLYVRGDTHLDGILRVQGAPVIEGNLTVSGGTITAGNVATALLFGNTTTNITFGGALTSGTLIVGGASQTGTTTLTRSTVTHTLDIASGVSLASTSKTVNIASGGGSGSNTLLTLGSSTAGAISTVRILSPTNLILGATTATGTASQPLQVTGGAYVSGNLGIGTTNPTSALSVVGNTLITGITTVGIANTSTPPNNSQMSFELTSDTNLRIKVRGTDGVLRSANITLA